jgi:hypothetical protein
MQNQRAGRGRFHGITVLLQLESVAVVEIVIMTIAGCPDHLVKNQVFIRPFLLHQNDCRWSVERAPIGDPVIKSYGILDFDEPSAAQ